MPELDQMLGSFKQRNLIVNAKPYIPKGRRASQQLHVGEALQHSYAVPSRRRRRDNNHPRNSGARQFTNVTRFNVAVIGCDRKYQPLALSIATFG